jgi:hypothetical protein
LNISDFTANHIIPSAKAILPYIVRPKPFGFLNVLRDNHSYIAGRRRIITIENIELIKRLIVNAFCISDLLLLPRQQP